MSSKGFWKKRIKRLFSWKVLGSCVFLAVGLFNTTGMDLFDIKLVAVFEIIYLIIILLAPEPEEDYEEIDFSELTQNLEPGNNQPNTLGVFKNEAEEYCYKIRMFIKNCNNKELCKIVSSSHEKIRYTIKELDENEIRSGELSKLNSKYLSNYTKLLDSYKTICSFKNMDSEFTQTIRELEEAIIQYDTAFDGLYKKAVESDLLAASIDARVNKQILTASGLMGSDFEIGNKNEKK